MITLLLAEDELLVRTGLRMLIDWEAEGIRIAAEAGNGREALELIRQHRPDMVLTDILMPQMSGLELMRALKEEGFGGLTAVLSNHDDFRYTREAMRCGAADYILKTDLNRESFLRFIRGLKEKLPPREGSGSSPGEASDIRRLLKECLLGREAPSRKRSGELLPESWRERSYRPGILQIRSADGGGERKEQLQRIAEGVVTAGRAFFFDAGHDRSYLILLLHGPPEELAERRLRALEKRLRNALSAYLDLSFFWGLGPLCPGPEGLGDAYAAAETVLWASFFRPGETLGFPHAAGGKEEGGELSEQLARLIHSGAPEERKRAVRELFATLKTLENPGLLKSVCLRLIAFLNRQKAELALEGAAAGSRQLPLNALWRLPGLDALEHLFSDALRGLEEQEGGQPRDLLDRSLAYIAENLSRPLSLSDAAEQAGLSGSYFSSWFKEKTGERFSDYLIRRRLALARELLETRPELRIYEVAAACGVPNEKYFSRLFKSHCGRSPREHRKGVHQSRTECTLPGGGRERS